MGDLTSNKDFTGKNILNRCIGGDFAYLALPNSTHNNGVLLFQTPIKVKNTHVGNNKKGIKKDNYQSCFNFLKQ